MEASKENPLDNQAGLRHIDAKKNPPDLIRAFRLSVIREVEILLEKTTRPGFVGNCSIGWASKNGRPNTVPKVVLERFGFSD